MKRLLKRETEVSLHSVLKILDPIHIEVAQNYEDFSETEQLLASVASYYGDGINKTYSKNMFFKATVILFDITVQFCKGKIWKWHFSEAEELEEGFQSACSPSPGRCVCVCVCLGHFRFDVVLRQPSLIKIAQPRIDQGFSGHTVLFFVIYFIIYTMVYLMKCSYCAYLLRQQA